MLPVYCMVCLVLFGTHLTHVSGTSLMFELPDNENFCINELFDGPVRCVFEYRVTRGGNHDVDASVRTPNGKFLYKQHKMQRDRFEFETSRGEYQFCFSNEFSTFRHKLIYFDLRPEELESLAGEVGDKKPFVQTAGQSSCDNIHESMTSMVTFQRDYRLKESIGRHIAEGLRKRVTWWSLGQSVVVIITGLGQIFVLRRFFTERVTTENSLGACRPSYITCS